MQQIGEQLREHSPRSIWIVVDTNDDEAHQYAANLAMAIGGGNWPVEWLDEKVRQPGLHIRYKRARTSEGNSETTHIILSEVLTKGGARIIGSGGSMCKEGEQEEVRLLVGPRPRGTQAIPIPLQGS